MPDRIDRLRAALADRYAIEKEIGAGGMATVYLAEDLRHRRKVAIKVLRAELAATVGPERLLREIEIAAGLSHPNILPLHDSGEADGFLFYVMPFVEGETLRDRLEHTPRVSLDEAIRITREVADALEYAHGRVAVGKAGRGGGLAPAVDGGASLRGALRPRWERGARGRPASPRPARMLPKLDAKCRRCHGRVGQSESGGGAAVQPSAPAVLVELADPGLIDVLAFGAVGFLIEEISPDLRSQIRRAHVFVGHSGRGPGQLEAEMDQQSWIIEPARE